MRPRKTAPIPKSVPRDINLYVLEKHHPRLASAIVKSTVKYMPRKGIIRATIDFDPDLYIKAMEKR
jgi:hypothetical protein